MSLICISIVLSMVLLRYIVGQERILNQLIFCAVGANPYVHTIVTPTAWLDCRCEALVRQGQLRLTAGQAAR